MSEAAALLALLATLAAAVARPRFAPDWAVAAACAVALVATGVLTLDDARDAARDPGRTLAFLAALLVLADGCRVAALFEALGAAIASGARGRPRRLLAMVFAAAAATTAVLSLDATVLLLTPVVFATAARLRISARPHVYACSHLANSASLLLPVSNLTNLLAFERSGLSFTRFAALMALPWLAALAVEGGVLARAFRSDLEAPANERAVRAATVPVPRFALGVVAATLAGFALSSLVRLGPVGGPAAGGGSAAVGAVWGAGGGARARAGRGGRGRAALVRAAEPPFLVFVLGLAVIVRAA